MENMRRGILVGVKKKLYKTTFLENTDGAKLWHFAKADVLMTIDLIFYFGQNPVLDFNCICMIDWAVYHDRQYRRSLCWL